MFTGVSSVPQASGNPACRGTFGGRSKAVRDHFALQGVLRPAQLGDLGTPGVPTSLRPSLPGCQAPGEPGRLQSMGSQRVRHD